LPKKAAIKPLDVVVLSVLAAAGIYLFYRVRIGLQYRWEWEAIPQYLFRYDPVRETWVSNVLVEGLLTTIRLSIWSILLATVLGTVAGLLRISPRLLHRLMGRSYVESIRNLPPLVLVFIFYYFISDQVMPVLGIERWARSADAPVQQAVGMFFAPPGRLNAFISALAALAVFEGAYIAEIVRAGIQSVDKGQWEAARALGLSRWHRMRRVIGPQAVRSILPPLAGQFVSTIKDSSIVAVISLQELTFQAMELMSATYLTFEIWVTVTVLYLLLTFPCALAVGRLESRFQRHERAT
jgi:polar amino acid transport system permease protein